MGAGFVPSGMRMDLVDEVVAVDDDEALDAARELARVEGLFGGSSSGANLQSALRIAERLGAGKRVVTVVVDSGLKYLSGELYGQAPARAQIESRPKA